MYGARAASGLRAARAVVTAGVALLILGLAALPMRARIPWLHRIKGAYRNATLLRTAETMHREFERRAEEAPHSTEDPGPNDGAAMLEPRSQRIGEQIEDLAFTNLDGSRGRLSDLARCRALVVAVDDIGCPVSNRYAPSLNALAHEYETAGACFVRVNFAASLSASVARDHVSRYDLRGRYVLDPQGEFGRALRVQTTTDTFVLDSARTLLYRGAIDDQYGVGYVKPEAKHRYLRDAISSVLSGTDVRVKATAASGCLLDFSPGGAPASREITYHNRISRIVSRSCQQCHRPGGGAPLPFLEYAEVRDRAPTIRYVLEKRLMPPWNIAPGSGPWANDFGLTDEERQHFIVWIERGCPEGNPQDEPPTRRVVSGWRIGRPDAVLRIPTPVRIPAQGFVPYKSAYVKTDFPGDRWVQKVEIVSRFPEALHHLLAFTLPPGQATLPGGEQRFGAVFTSELFTGAGPGGSVSEYPEGTARFLPRGAVLWLQLHYVPTGRKIEDRPEIALVFARNPPRRALFSRLVVNLAIEIPAGDPHHEESAEYTFARPAKIYSFFPHMHYRGKAFRYELTLPDGSRKELLNVTRFDFNAQHSYDLLTPLDVPAGSRLRVVGIFDNSAANRANPDLRKTVRYGDESTDEMLIGNFDYTRP